MLQLIFISSLLVGSSFSVPVEDYSRSGARIVGGTDANILEFPNTVSLRAFGGHSCAGTILSPEWILTAGHCVYGSAPSLLSIQYGSTKIDRNSPNVIDVETIILHEDFLYEFEPFRLQNDIALLKLEKPIDMGEIENRVKLPVPNQFFPTGTPTIVVGWGLNDTGYIQETLQKTTLQIFTAKDCRDAHRGTDLEIVFSNICAGVIGGGRAECNGDSGGPLFVNGVQVGVVSWSIKPCGNPEYPGVYTAVTPFIGWIQHHTGLTFDLGFFLRSF